MTEITLKKSDLKKLMELRSILSFGDNTTQIELDAITEEFEKFKSVLRPNEKDESFTLVDQRGNFKDMEAPRWLCHVLGLRHKSVHILLQWASPGLGNVFILQTRSWTKSDSPGRLDISVGGHVTGDSTAHTIESAYKEMKEELGISEDDLIDKTLLFKIGYQNVLEEREDDHFYNKEWRDVYVGRITTDRLAKIQFKDKEVVGLYLCPESQAKNLLCQGIIPLANALKESLPRCLE